MEHPILEEALRLAELGYPVFPCGGKTGKEPRTANGFKDATTDEAVIERWFGGAAPPNLAIPTAEMFSIDVDPLPGGKPNGWPDDPDRTMELSEGAGAIQRTPRGGVHYLFGDSNQTYRNTTSVIGPNVDTRATGGYIIVPPSSTRWGSYEWLKPLDCPPDQLPPVPDWVDALLTSKPTGGVGPIRTDEEWLALMANPPSEGSRNDGLARVVGKLLSMGAGYEEVLATGYQWAARCSPPMDPVEVGRTIRSIYDAHRRNHGEGQQQHRVEQQIRDLKESGVELAPAVEQGMRKAAKQADEAREVEAAAKRVQGIDQDGALDYVRKSLDFLGEPVQEVRKSTQKAGYVEWALIMESGRRVELGGTEALQIASRFEKAVIEEFSVPLSPRLKGKKVWPLFVTAFCKAAIVTDPSYDPAEECREWVRDYAADCDHSGKGDSWRERHQAKLPYVSPEGELRLSFQDFLTHMRVNGYHHLDRKGLLARLEAAGFRRGSFNVLVDGKQVGRSLYALPTRLLFTPEGGKTNAKT